MDHRGDEAAHVVGVGEGSHGSDNRTDTPKAGTGNGTRFFASWNASARKRRTARNGTKGRKTDRNPSAFIPALPASLTRSGDSTTDPAALPATGHRQRIPGTRRRSEDQAASESGPPADHCTRKRQKPRKRVLPVSRIFDRLSD